MKKILFFFTLLLSFLQGFSQPEFPVTYPPYSRYDFLPILRFNPVNATWKNYKTPAFSLSGIDSVRVIGDSVCQFKNGVRTCNAINVGSASRFGYPGEDVSTDVDRYFNAKGNAFALDSLGFTRFNGYGNAIQFNHFSNLSINSSDTGAFIFLNALYGTNTIRSNQFYLETDNGIGGVTQNLQVIGGSAVSDWTFDKAHINFSANILSTSASPYDIVVRNQSTGYLEKVSSGTFATPGLQAVITANNKLNKNDTLNLQGHDFLTDSAGTVFSRVGGEFVIETLSGNTIFNQDVSGELSSFDNSNHLKFHSDGDGTLYVNTSDGAGGFSNRFHIDAGGANVDAYFQNLAKFQVNANDSISLQAADIYLRGSNSIKLYAGTGGMNLASGDAVNVTSGGNSAITFVSDGEVDFTSSNGSGIDFNSDADINFTTTTQLNIQGSFLPNADVTFDLGSNSNSFRVLYTAGDVLKTASTPSTPASGSVALWYDGTNLKYKKSDGSTGIIF